MASGEGAALGDGAGPLRSCPFLVLKYVAFCTIFHREKRHFNIFQQHSTSCIIVHETNNIVQYINNNMVHYVASCNIVYDALAISVEAPAGGYLRHRPRSEKAGRKGEGSSNGIATALLPFGDYLFAAGSTKCPACNRKPSRYVAHLLIMRLRSAR